eukprot:TRINITY_DN15298_c0_g1_i1.p1 TRINITY_DN15298_c0_g1~~TRINITY_DN15298_c0_g1_i1.p1  ORF type:complete len:166 (+),score=8.18 TRINITY_DN15298_c0_g1_i1:5-502(+)
MLCCTHPPLEKQIRRRPREAGNTNKTVPIKNPNINNQKTTQPSIMMTYLHQEENNQDMVRESGGRHRRFDSRIGGEKSNETRPAAHTMARQTQENSQKQNSADFDSDYKIAKSRSYATLPGERASVVLRQKHKHLGGQGREEVTNSGVFSLPRVSCYHRSTRVWV